MLKKKYLIFIALLGFLFSDFSSNVKVGFDSNILKYSNPENPISSNFIKLGMGYKSKLNIIDRKTQMSLNFVKSIYDLSEKSNYSFGLKLKQPLGKYRYLMLSYKYIDNIYLREYVDVDQGVLNSIYQGTNCSFDNSIIDIGYELPILKKKSKINIHYIYQTQFYNKYFTEFDLELHGLKLKYIRQLKNNKSNIFSFRFNYAKNLTLNDFTLSTSYMDRGYSEYLFSLVEKDKLKGMSVDLVLRKYSSSIIEDQLHLDRRHIDVRSSFWNSYKFFGRKNKLIFKYRKRVTYSSYSWVKNIKSFDKLIIEHNMYF